MAESGNTSIDHFIRQRRNLVVTSLFIIFYKVAELEVQQINLLGNEIKVGNPTIISSALGVFFAYFLWRYYTSCREIGGIARFWDACASWAENKCTKHVHKRRSLYLRKFQGRDAQIETLGRKPFCARYRLSSYNPSEGNLEEKTLVIKWRFLLMKIIAIVPTTTKTSNFSEYILPYFLAMIALGELLNMGFIAVIMAMISDEN